MLEPRALLEPRAVLEFKAALEAGRAPRLESPYHQRMFLAWREIKESPTRFALIVAVIALMSYLTFFLASLAGGLAFSYRAAIDQWDSKTVALAAAANKNPVASVLSSDQVDSLISPQDASGSLQDASGSPQEASAISVRAVVVDANGDEEKTDAFVFRVDPDSFLMPPVSEGELPSDTSVVVDSSLKQAGWQIGDEITFAGDETVWTVGGFAENQTFQAAPLLFVSSDYDAEMPISAVVGKGELTTDDDAIEVITTAQLIQNLPGYQAQVLTFSLMIGALIIIASFVLGIFIYVLTLQKRAMLGILKARGVPTRYLIWSGGAQATMLSVTGVAVGMVLTVLSSLVLPEQVPFKANLLIDTAITGGFVLFSVLGGLFSVKVVSKIDPVEAIS